MKKLLTLALLLAGSIANAQDVAAQAQELLNQHITQNISTGISAGYASSENILWLGYAGQANEETEKVVDATTIFRMASIAKPITAIATLQLVEKGKLDLDQPISSYLPDFPIKEGTAITARHLLQHSSGIGGYKSSKESETKKEYPTLLDAINVFKDRPLRFKPGTDFYYTSYGYVVLGWVIEKVSGQSYETYVQEHILDKAGMRNTGIESFANPPDGQTSFYSQKNRLTKDYDAADNKLKKLDRTNLSNRTPGGGFYTTAADLLKFGQAILTEKLIKEKSTNLMWTDSGLKKQGNPYGMGWYLYGENPKYGPVYGHSGTQAGASNQIMILPEEKLVVIGMSNTSHSWGHVFGMTVRLFDIGSAHKNE